MPIPRDVCLSVCLPIPRVLFYCPPLSLCDTRFRWEEEECDGCTLRNLPYNETTLCEQPSPTTTILVRYYHYPLQYDNAGHVGSVDGLYVDVKQNLSITELVCAVIVIPFDCVYLDIFL